MGIKPKRPGAAPKVDEKQKPAVREETRETKAAPNHNESRQTKQTYTGNHNESRAVR